MPSEQPFVELPREPLQAFLGAIRDCPSDNLNRQAFADWLEEHGDARADLIRALAGTDKFSASRWLEQYTDRWFGTLPAGVRVRGDVELGYLVATVDSHRLEDDETKVPEGFRRALAEGWCQALCTNGEPI